MERKSLLTQFEEDGFVKIKSLFSKQEIAKIRDEVARYQHEVLPKIPEQEYIKIENDPNKIPIMGRMDLYDDFFKELHQDMRLFQVAEMLLGNEATTQHIQFFNIIPGYTRATPPHQDAFNFLIDPSNAVALWIPLTEVNENNGGLRYVKGSHKKGHRHHTKRPIATWVVDPFTQDDVDLEVGVEAERGDVVAHHCFTIHRSSENDSPEQRWALGAIYYDASFHKVHSRSAWLEKYGPSSL